MTDKPDLFDLAAGVPTAEGVPKIEGEMRPAPKAADRISKRVIFLALIVFGIIVGTFFLALANMDKPKKDASAKLVANNSSVSPGKEDASGIPGFGESPKEGKGASLSTPKASEAAVDSPHPGDKPRDQFPAKSAIPSNGMVPAISSTGMGTIPPAEQVAISSAPVLTPAQQLENQEKVARHGRMTQARNAGLSGKSFGSDDKAAAAASVDVARMLAAAKETGGPGGMPVNFSSASKTDGEQDSKLEFLKGMAKEENRYHPHIPMPALSANEIKTGSFIPMVLEQGINSDLPGQITARVTEDVYDSITGCRLLVPAMSKVVGRYDSKIAIGQGRMLVGWNAMIFPDGAELNLGGMQGYDTSGQSGLESDVDNHYLRLFGVTFGLSMITAGVTLSVPQPNPGATGSSAPPTSAQTVAAALAQQYGNLGAQILGKYMAVQPTLRNSAGERFVVMVPKTIVFNKVWRNRCVAQR
jgi:type IV secretion system protein TrbI